MSNYIRSDFCIDGSVEPIGFLRLLRDLQLLGCSYTSWEAEDGRGQVPTGDAHLPEERLSTAPDRGPLEGLAELLARPGYRIIKITLQTGEGACGARLLQIWGSGFPKRRISFDVEEGIFLPGRTVSFTPRSNAVFGRFKQILTRIAVHLQPTSGVIDYDADFLCDELSTARACRSFVHWGNYYSHALLRHWPREAVAKLLAMVDEFTVIDDLGVLTFLHPLAANQAWTSRHENVLALLIENGARRGV